MSKITITIDDANPAIVAAFGADSLIKIADQLGYMEKVEKTEEELPAKVEVVVDGETILQYPEGTEMYKDNPQTRGTFIAEIILKDKIIPTLLASYENELRRQSNEENQAKMTNAKEVIKSATEIVIV